MKIIILLFALVFGFGATCKKTANDLKEIKIQQELDALAKQHPNLLPVVVITPTKS